MRTGPAVVVAAFAVLSPLTAWAAGPARPFNVVLIVADDPGWADVGCQGADVARFTASTDAPTVSEAGESFRVRGIADGERVEPVTEKAVASAARVKATPETTPRRR